MNRTGHIDKAQLAEHYGDPDLAEAVYQDAVERGTLRRILKGELHWPSAQDARHWIERRRTEEAQRRQAERRAQEEARPLPGEPGHEEDYPDGVRSPEL